MADGVKLGPFEVTPIGLGCWQFSGGKGMAGGFWPALPQEEVNAIVRASLDGGVRWFDTAEAYGAGRSEAALARALRATGKAPGDVVVATKWFPFLRTASSIGRTIGDRLRHLDGFPIDLYQIHSPLGSLATHRSKLNAMARLVNEGRVRAVGISNFGARATRKAYAVLAKHGLPLASNQVRYSLLDRRIERNGVLDTARELGVTIIAYSPLAQGLLTGKFHDDPELAKRKGGPRRYMSAFRQRGLDRSAPVIEELRRIGAEHHATPAQIALRWVIQRHGDLVVAIPGATKVSHAVENAAALGMKLTEEELERLDTVSGAFR